MNTFLTLAFLFAAGSLIGWVIEVIFRKFFSRGNPEHKWINPGFLAGPCIPLYGVSIIVLYLLAMCEEYIPIESRAGRQAALFIIMALCVTAIEYFVGWLTMRWLKVRLWDYSNIRGNINGYICPLFTFFWAILSAIYYFFVHPYILDALDWLSQNLAFSFGIGFFYGIFVIDFAYSAQLVSRIRTFAKENDIIVRFEELRDEIRAENEKRREKTRFILSMRSRTPLSEVIRNYAERKKAELEQLAEEYKSHNEHSST